MLYRLEVRTTAPVEFHEITERVQASVHAGGVTAGLCYVVVPHTTAGVTINENADPDVRRDMIHALEGLVPRHDPAYRHAEGNSAAHVKASLMGFSAVVPVQAGRLVLGTWQGIYLCEFDGPRRRRVLLTVVAVDG
ncbi:MAG: secondary thiamine-phosphate synthase enzyme YjbQ [Chloroflexota bacterium]